MTGIFVPRHVRISEKHRSERVLEWSEPGFVVAPLLERLAEDRLSDLLGAGGTYRALVLVELQAALLEWQAAIRQQRAHLRLGILDHAFVVHAVHASGHHSLQRVP